MWISVLEGLVDAEGRALLVSCFFLGCCCALGGNIGLLAKVGVVAFFKGFEQDVGVFCEEWGDR